MGESFTTYGGVVFVRSGNGWDVGHVFFHYFQYAYIIIPMCFGKCITILHLLLSNSNIYSEFQYSISNTVKTIMANFVSTNDSQGHNVMFTAVIHSCNLSFKERE